MDTENGVQDLLLAEARRQTVALEGIRSIGYFFMALTGVAFAIWLVVLFG